MVSFSPLNDAWMLLGNNMEMVNFLSLNPSSKPFLKLHKTSIGSGWSCWTRQGWVWVWFAVKGKPNRGCRNLLREMTLIPAISKRERVRGRRCASIGLGQEGFSTQKRGCHRLSFLQPWAKRGRADAVAFLLQLLMLLLPCCWLPQPDSILAGPGCSARCFRRQADGPWGLKVARRWKGELGPNSWAGVREKPGEREGEFRVLCLGFIECRERWKWNLWDLLFWVIGCYLWLS